MRIGILFYGQPRFFGLTKKYIKQEFDFPGHETDYFAHFWEQVGYTPSGEEHDTNVPDVRKILSREFDAKSYKIQNYDKLDEIIEAYKVIFQQVKEETNNNVAVPDDDLELRYKFGQHYSLSKCYEYLEEYEQKNNFKYDIIIKARTDIVYSLPSLYSDEEEYRLFKIHAYLNINKDVPTIHCNGIRITTLEVPDDNSPLIWEQQGIYSYYNQEVSFQYEHSVKMPFTYNYNRRLAINDWCLIANREAASLMYNGWFTTYLNALGNDIRMCNCLRLKNEPVIPVRGIEEDELKHRHKLKFISQSEHSMQGYLAYVNNINAVKLKHRRDYRLLKQDEIKQEVSVDGKFWAVNDAEMVDGITKVFNLRNPSFYDLRKTERYKKFLDIKT